MIKAGISRPDTDGVCGQVSSLSTEGTLVDRFTSIWWWHDAMEWLGRHAQAHLRRMWWAWALAIVALSTVSHFFTLSVNGWTESLPDKTFLLLKQDKQVHRGDYIQFKWHGGGPYPKGLAFVKLVKGVPGDVVSVRDRQVFINGELVAVAKDRTRRGDPLEVGPQGVIPAGHYFVWTPHPDSLDSRYALTGWIKAEAIQGRAVPLF